MVCRLPPGLVVDAESWPSAPTPTYVVATTMVGVPFSVEVKVEVTGFRDPAGPVGFAVLKVVPGVC